MRTQWRQLRTSRGQSLGFARFLLQRYQTNPSRFVVDRDRVGIVLRRIVRGLFYREIGLRLPEFVPFQFVSIEDQPRKAAALRDVTDFLDWESADNWRRSISICVRAMRSDQTRL